MNINLFGFAVAGAGFLVLAEFAPILSVSVLAVVTLGVVLTKPANLQSLASIITPSGGKKK